MYAGPGLVVEWLKFSKALSALSIMPWSACLNGMLKNDLYIDVVAQVAVARMRKRDGKYS
jgi:hypothetical protein